MRDLKGYIQYANQRLKESKEKILTKILRKEVEIGANGTQSYVIKKGPNKGKIAKSDHRP